MASSGNIVDKLRIFGVRDPGPNPNKLASPLWSSLKARCTHLNGRGKSALDPPDPPP